MQNHKYISQKVEQGQSVGKRPLKGLQYFSLLTQLVEKYSQTFTTDSQDHKLTVSIDAPISKRLQLIESISNILEQTRLRCKIIENQKMDCIQQSLKIIKKIQKMNENLEKNKNKSQSFQNKMILQTEIVVIQKVADIILKVVTPKQLTIDKLTQMMSFIIQELFQIPLNHMKSKQVDKKKKITTSTKCIRKTIQYSLSNGKKVSLAWFLIFKLVQSILQKPIQQQSEMNQLLSNASQQSQNRLIDKVIHYTKQIIEQLIAISQSSNLVNNLLNFIISNISQLQLSITPFFLNSFSDIMVKKFKQGYKIFIQNNSAHKMQSQYIFSLENIKALLGLINVVDNDMIQYQMQKQVLNCGGICSYCGIKKSNERERLIYQKITIKLSQQQNLIIRICANCCQSIGQEPENSQNLIFLAPIIYSKFWKHDYINYKDILAKQSLKKLLLYRNLNEKNQKKRHLNDQKIEIIQPIAMNNCEQKMPNKLIEKTYKAYLFNHDKLSIKMVIVKSLQILLTYLNAKDGKLKEKVLRTINQQYLTDFFINIQQNEQRIIPQFQTIKEKVISVLQMRLNDSNLDVRLMGLEIMMKIHSKEDLDPKIQLKFFKFVYKQIAQSSNCEYTVKSIDIIQKLITTTKQSTKQPFKIQYTQFILSTLVFTISCLTKNERKSEDTLKLKDKVYKLHNKLLVILHQICKKEYSQQENSLLLIQFNNFLEKKLNKLNDVYSQILVKMLKQMKLAPNIIKSIPFMTSKIMQSLIIQTEQLQQCQTQAKCIEFNLNSIIDILNESYQQFNELINPKKDKKHSNQIRQIRQYFCSNQFIDILLRNKETRKPDDLSIEIISPNSLQNSNLTIQIPNGIKLRILCKILQLNNKLSIINKQKQIMDYMHIWINKKRKSNNNPQFNICIGIKNKGDMELLHKQLLNSIQLCQIDSIHQKCNSIVHLLMFLDKSDAIKGYINYYNKLSRKFFNKILSNIENVSIMKEQDLFKELYSNYTWITRSLIILISLTTCLEKYIKFNERIKSQISKEISSMERQQLIRSNNNLPNQSTLQVDNEPAVETSFLFGNSYSLLVQILLVQCPEVANTIIINNLVRKLMMFLQYYWEIHPQIILISKHLLQKIVQNTNDVILMKSLYKLFTLLLPCNNIRILSLINYNFSLTFHKMIMYIDCKNDDEFIGWTYKILYSLLKSGMTGLHEYNKYVLLGLMHHSTEVSQISSNIIKEIYSRQASEKMLLNNLSETLMFIYQYYYSFERKNIFSDIVITQKQQKNLQILFNLTRNKSKILLQRQKRQIKIKSTFIKKIGEFLLKDLDILKQKTLYLYFILKIIKSHHCMDFSQLYQISYTIKRLVEQNLTYVENLKESVQSQIHCENSCQDLNLFATYRQLISCLTYLTFYQPVEIQLKNYSKLLQNSPSPYMILKQHIATQPINPSQNIHANVSIIFQDIDLHMDIMMGDIELVESMDSGQQLSQSSNITVRKTKAKKNNNNSKYNRENKTKRNKPNSFISFSTQKVIDSSITRQSQIYKKHLRNKSKKEYFE